MRQVGPHLVLYGLRVSVDGADDEVVGIPAVGACMLHQLEPQLFVSSDNVVDLGCGAGFDCFVASGLVGDEGEVVGVDMTDEMLSKSRALADELGLNNIEFRDGLLEELPVEDAWADVAISNGVINLCSDKKKAMAEIYRILKPGGYLQFADIANSKPVPQAAVENIDLWTA